ncbi:MAG: histidine kinase [Desulfobacterales bacterium S3730MH5]|nr:MAG: histidine kinase [Desulfobacterales bacterium S3730MH5]OEU82301.1 MAG: histidine kinase [Desulfobulbaceae bacterium C00003063]OEU84788.1 MAG: histidine kinase [Desulfobacterales bacterium S5133MH4]
MKENHTSERHIDALTRISKAITSDRYIEDILRLVVTVTAETMRSKICALWLLDDNDNTLRLRATQSISEDYLKERSLKMGEGIVGQVALAQKPRSVINVLEEPDYKEKELAEKEGLVSMLSVPMVVRDRVIGVINCYTSYSHQFTETEKNVLITVASGAAVAIENTELMVKTKVIREELESRKLIERAKDILMTRRGLSGAEAYRWIQKRSMDTRKSMREISEAIVLTEEI